MAKRRSPADSGSRGGVTLGQQRGERSRQQILDAAMTLFSRNGYTATSITQLSKACGLPL